MIGVLAWSLIPLALVAMWFFGNLLGEIVTVFTIATLLWKVIA